MKLGELVAGKYDKENWHRAKIIDIVKVGDVDKVDVYYVDYGDSAYVYLDRLSKLERKFTELPIQAVECKLDGCTSIDGSRWSDDALDYFEDVTYSSRWKKLKLQLIEGKSAKTSKPIVTLFDKNKVIFTISLIKFHNFFNFFSS